MKTASRTTPLISIILPTFWPFFALGMRLLKGWFGRGMTALERPPEPPYSIEGRSPVDAVTRQAMLLETVRNAVGMVERSAVRRKRWIHRPQHSRATPCAVRLGALVLAFVMIAAVGGRAGATTSPLRLQVTFSGTAQEQFNDVERWTSLQTNQCVLRRSRDEATTLTWSLAWRGAPGARSVSAEPPASQGTVAGTEVRDSCDVAPAQLPADAPQDWLTTLNCSDPLLSNGGGALTITRRAAQVVIGVATPGYAVSPDAQCTAEPRADQLRARLPLKLADLTRLVKGASKTYTVGSSVTRFGSYTPQLNCMHAAKPYDGYRSYDQCQDLLTWSGTLRVTRL